MYGGRRTAGGELDSKGSKPETVRTARETPVFEGGIA
jgi:hypothetical protein